MAAHWSHIMTWSHGATYRTHIGRSCLGFTTSVYVEGNITDHPSYDLLPSNMSMAITSLTAVELCMFTVTS